MIVESTVGHDELLEWESFDSEGESWFKGTFEKNSGQYLKGTDRPTGLRLQQIFQAGQNAKFSIFTRIRTVQSFHTFGFPKNWGLGTSSTLIYNLAQWATVDAFELLEMTFGGSGYDIACAGAKQAITFYKTPEPHYKEVFFDPIFKSQLYFVYLTKKQNSRDGIARYRTLVKEKDVLINDITAITKAMQKALRLSDFEELIKEHEAIVSSTLNLARAKRLFFNDFWGEVKSLGAWGGDFVLVTSEASEAETRKYFSDRGFGVCLKYEDLVL
ncbi:MAG: GHMP kinase [Saprospiraceae bacterium]|nr:GHMP kinase [Saprospiraceae bacterium]